MVGGLFKWLGVCSNGRGFVVSQWNGRGFVVSRHCPRGSGARRSLSLPKAGVRQWPHANGVRSGATHGVQRGVARPINSESPPNGGRMNGCRIISSIRRTRDTITIGCTSYGGRKIPSDGLSIDRAIGLAPGYRIPRPSLCRPPGRWLIGFLDVEYRAGFHFEGVSLTAGSRPRLPSFVRHAADCPGVVDGWIGLSGECRFPIEWSRACLNGWPFV